ncbi:unnamed protein product [Closterium sp. NIES-65]|nr:unnamed protein product [Closterium sp. NIES-65]
MPWGLGYGTLFGLSIGPFQPLVVAEPDLFHQARDAMQAVVSAISCSFPGMGYGSWEVWLVRGQAAVEVAVPTRDGLNRENLILSEESERRARGALPVSPPDIPRSLSPFSSMPPSLCPQILIAKSSSFQKNQNARRVVSFLANGLVFSDGAFWARQRKMISHAFSPSYLKVSGMGLVGYGIGGMGLVGYGIGGMGLVGYGIGGMGLVGYGIGGMGLVGYGIGGMGLVGYGIGGMGLVGYGIGGMGLVGYGIVGQSARLASRVQGGELSGEQQTGRCSSNGGASSNGGDGRRKRAGRCSSGFTHGVSAFLIHPFIPSTPPSAPPVQSPSSPLSHPNLPVPHDSTQWAVMDEQAHRAEQQWAHTVIRTLILAEQQWAHTVIRTLILAVRQWVHTVTRTLILSVQQWMHTVTRTQILSVQQWAHTVTRTLILSVQHWAHTVTRTLILSVQQWAHTVIRTLILSVQQWAHTVIRTLILSVQQWVHTVTRTLILSVQQLVHTHTWADCLPHSFSYPHSHPFIPSSSQHAAVTAMDEQARRAHAVAVIDEQARRAEQQWVHTVTQASGSSNCSSSGRGRGRGSGSGGCEMDMYPAFTALTLGIIGLAAFGNNLSHSFLYPPPIRNPHSTHNRGVRSTAAKSSGASHASSDEKEMEEEGQGESEERRAEEEGRSVREVYEALAMRPTQESKSLQQASSVACFSRLQRSLFLTLASLSSPPPRRPRAAEPVLHDLRWLPTQENSALQQAAEKVTRLSLDLIARRRQEQAGDSRKDLLAVMLAARDDVSNEQMTDQQLVDECVTFLLAGVLCGGGVYDVSNECSAEASATQVMLPCSLTPPIVSGHETTAKLLTWAVYLLARYPDWQRRVREEVWRVMGSEMPEGGGGGGGANREGGGEKLELGGEKGEGGGEGEKEEGGGEAAKGNGRRGGGRKVTWEQVGRLSEMHMVLLETLRLFPPTPVITREAVKHVSLGPYSLPAGTRITMAIGMAQSDPRFWGEDALEFNPLRFKGEIQPIKPQRWAGEEAQQLIRGACSHPQAFLPFSAGPRDCIGSNFALSEAKVVLAHMLSRLEWELSPTYVHLPTMGIALSPKYGMPLRMRLVE